jgi:hypothetical protein
MLTMMTSTLDGPSSRRPQCMGERLLAYEALT